MTETDHLQFSLDTKILTILWEDLPSQYFGTFPFLYLFDIILSNSSNIFSVSVPTTVLLPIVSVTGLSVFSRKVRHGILRTVVSS